MNRTIPSDEQKKQLAEPMRRETVKSREGPWDPKTRKKKLLYYMTGHQAIDNANRIFGFEGWSFELLSLDRVIEQDVKIGKDKDKDGWLVQYRATVRTTYFGQPHEDVGYGDSTQPMLTAAHEAAGKEAVTDAMKRALRHAGNQFGNALYDEEKAGVETREQALERQAEEEKGEQPAPSSEPPPAPAEDPPAEAKQPDPAPKTPPAEPPADPKKELQAQFKRLGELVWRDILRHNCDITNPKAQINDSNIEFILNLMKKTPATQDEWAEVVDFHRSTFQEHDFIDGFTEPLKSLGYGQAIEIEPYFRAKFIGIWEDNLLFHLSDKLFHLSDKAT